MMDRPLILTARMDDASFRFFDELRRLHFPPERNFLRAHITLFHALPASGYAVISDKLAAVAAVSPAAELRFAGWRSLGRGVAMNVVSPFLSAIRAEIARRFSDELKPQDRQNFRPHITVQNKATPVEAAELLADLTARPLPETGQAIALDLWRYLGGPWELLGSYKFDG